MIHPYLHTGVIVKTDVEIIKSTVKMSEFWPFFDLGGDCELVCFLNLVRTNESTMLSSGSQRVH